MENCGIGSVAAHAPFAATDPIVGRDFPYAEISPKAMPNALATPSP